MLANLLLGLRMLGELLVVPLLCGALTLWLAAWLWRRPAGPGRVAAAGAFSALVYATGVGVGLWRDGALLAYNVLVLSAALCSVLLLRR